MNQYEILKKYIEGLNKGLSKSLLIEGIAGIGKTETTLKSLQEMGLKEGTHYLYYQNYITPVELYLLLEKVNELQPPRILVLDDVEDTLSQPKAQNLLKGALWAFNNDFRVEWHSGTWKIKNKIFNFNGRIIFLVNELNKKIPLLNALKDRTLYYQMSLSQEEIWQLLKERANQPYHNIPQHKRKEIVNYLQKVVASKNISLRILPKAFQLFCLSPNHWKLLVDKII